MPGSVGSTTRPHVLGWTCPAGCARVRTRPSKEGPVEMHNRSAFVFATTALVLVAGSATARADDGGWTALSPGASSRVIYVSSSSGVDTNSGLSTTAPVRTLSKAYSLLRDGSPDWV